MAKGDIVIVSCMADLHADEMVLQLQEMGHEPIRLNTDDIPLNTTISFSLPSSQSTWQSKITFQSHGRGVQVIHFLKKEYNIASAEAQVIHYSNFYLLLAGKLSQVIHFSR